MCDCRPQVAGQPVLSRPSAGMAGTRWLTLHGHDQRDQSEPATAIAAAATALGSLAFSFVPRPQQPGRPQTSRASVPDGSLAAASVDCSMRYRISRLTGKLSATPFALTAGFSFLQSESSVSEACVAPCAGHWYLRNVDLGCDEQQTDEHLNHSSTGSELLGQIASQSDSWAEFSRQSLATPLPTKGRA